MHPGGPPLGSRIVVAERAQPTIDQRDRGRTIQAAAQLMFEGIAK